MPRWTLGVEYDGSAFCGWQSQADNGAVQDAIQHALLPLHSAKIKSDAENIESETDALLDIKTKPSIKMIKESLGESAEESANATNDFVLENEKRIVVHASGRTDAGVHAALQIVHFDSPMVRPPDVWRRALNFYLPSAASVLWAQEVPSDFHARYSARRRLYSYYVSTAPSAPAILHGRIMHYPQTMCEDSLTYALSYLQGAHDFSAFRAASCQSRTPCRNMHSATLSRRNDIWQFAFCADGFLHHMVRNMMGALFLVGIGQKSPQWIKQLLESKDRRLVPATAPAHGLYLCGAQYPPNFSLPEFHRDIWFF